MARTLRTVHSVDEFRRLYYPAPDPQLEYFDGHEPDENAEEGDGSVFIDPLDRFRRLLVQDKELAGRER